MRFISRFLKTLLIIGIIGALVYGVGIGYYSNKFQANTKIGKVDVSNLTLPQAKDKITNYIMEQTIQIKENNQTIGELAIKDLNPEFNQLDRLEALYNYQNPNSWLSYFFKTAQYDDMFLSDVKIEDQNLSEQLHQNGLKDIERKPAQDAYLDYNDSKGYYIVEEKQGTQIDRQALKNGIMNQIQLGENAIDLNLYYVKPKITRDDEKLHDFQEQIEDISDIKLTLDIEGNEEIIPKNEIQKWIYFDSNNKMVFDENLIMEFLKQYNDKYSSYLNTRKFSSTLQGQVTVQPGTLGWSIDRQAEASQIVQDLKAGKDVKRDPIVVGSGYGSGGNDIGSTYVEVDLANQTMFVYLNGELFAQTPIVSGKIGAETVPGAYAIWSKETDRYLQGFDWVKKEEYKVHVDYWMPFDDVGQGIHDTKGRPAYGGDVHYYSGSMGCINTPPAMMAQVFNALEIGTPVIVF